MQWLARIIIIICAGSLAAGCKTNQQRPDTSVDYETPAPRPKAEIAKINVQLGMAYLEQKNVQRAKQKFLVALQQGPGIPETWYSMAYFLEVTGNQTQANKYYLKSLEVAPGRGDAQNNYGTFLCRVGNYQAAIKHFMLAVNSPEYLDPAAAYENAGLCSMKMKAYKQASNYFQQALLKDPARSFSLLNLAQADIKLGYYKQAREVLKQYAIVSTPTSEYLALNKEVTRHLQQQTG